MNKESAKSRDFSITFESHSRFDGGVVSRISGIVEASQLAPILDNILHLTHSNPRSAARGPITAGIIQSLGQTPETFPFRSKGILLGASQYRSNGDERWHFKFEEDTGDGLLDGGHTLLGIGMHLLDQIPDETGLKIPQVKDWPSFARVWEENRHRIEVTAPAWDFHVPVEVIIPSKSNDADALTRFRNEIFDICAARNNNKQLSVWTQSNQRGVYDGIRDTIDERVSKNVIWRENAGGIIPAQNIISLAWIPLNLLLKQGILMPESESVTLPKPVGPAAIYSSRGMTLRRMQQLSDSLLGDWREDENKSGVPDARRALTNKHVHNAFGILRDLLWLHDLIYLMFPSTYNDVGGRFGTLHNAERVNSDSELSKNQRKKWATPFFKFPSYDFDDPYDVFLNYVENDKIAPSKSRFKYSEAYILPLTYGLQSLMGIDKKGIIVWAVDNPAVFLKDNFKKIVRDYKEVMFLQGKDTQSVGKNASNYTQAAMFFERAYQKSRKK